MFLTQHVILVSTHVLFLGPPLPVNLMIAFTCGKVFKVFHGIF